LKKGASSVALVRPLAAQRVLSDSTATKLFRAASPARIPSRSSVVVSDVAQ